MIKQLSNQYVELEYKSGIVIARYKSNLNINLEVARNLIKARKEVSDYNECKLYIDARNIKSISKEAREYVASKEGEEYLKATAILTNSNFVRILSNFLIRIDLRNSNSKLPIKLFSDEQDALNWLQNFK